ncbi:TRAP transporter small permease subunit [Aestuariivita sp.]|jgi:TRAP-type mannitol/chloroaromatic compound transport system permease small subunit|uniref:TRAP transporter small permease subunit n=1 Tax=Aestuariivita sp. TaxID=1872407 RepID=UPI00216B9285|nr:TRAP transporter small permease subunit [Aestuariivita sp.]MCE8009106.1 TRAP transporter small permease subunit [Aestuariivita sp.]
MNALTLSRWLSLPSRLAAAFIGCLLLVLTAVILYDVIGRKFFDTGSFVLSELEWHLHGAIAILGFGYAYLKDAHVRIDLFAKQLGPRLRLWLELVAILLFLIPFMIFLAWFGYDFAMRAYVRGEGAPGGLGLPNRWIIKSAIPLTAVLTITAALSVALRIWVVLRDPARLSDPFERD